MSRASPLVSGGPRSRGLGPGEGHKFTQTWNISKTRARQPVIRFIKVVCICDIYIYIYTHIITYIYISYIIIDYVG